MAKPRQSLQRSVLSSLLACLGAVIFTLVLGEIVARMIFGLHPLTSGSLVWIKHPQRGWQHHPNAGDYECWMSRRPEDVPTIMPYDSHRNQLGHEIYADCLTKFVIESGLLGATR